MSSRSQHRRVARAERRRTERAERRRADRAAREIERELGVTAAELYDEIIHAMVEVYRPHGMTGALAEALIAASENDGFIACAMEEPPSWVRDLDLLDRVGIILASHLDELGVPLADSLILDQHLRHRLGAPILCPDVDDLRRGVAAGEIEPLGEEALGALEAVERWNAERGIAPASVPALGRPQVHH